MDSSVHVCGHPAEYIYHEYLAKASRQLDDHLRLLNSLDRLRDNSSITEHATVADYNAFLVARLCTSNITARIRAEVDRRIKCYEAPSCRVLFRCIQDRLPRELRDVVYGLIFQGSRVELQTLEHDPDDPINRPLVKRNKKRRYPNTYLLEPDEFTIDAVTRRELIEAWYRTSTFIATNAETVGPSLSLFQWSVGINPLELIKHVEIHFIIFESPIAQAFFLRRWEYLFLLNTRTTITIILRNLNVYPRAGFEVGKCAESAAYLFPTLLRLGRAGFKVIVRAKVNLKIVVEPEETTVEGWANKFRETVEGVTT